MKELNQLENSLRSWTPRRPSASIKQRLFPNTAAVEHDLPDPLAWRWLLPAMALFVGALLVLAKSSHSGFGESAGLRTTFALSNLDFSTFYAAASQNEQHNKLAGATFDWTNGAHSSTTAPSFFDRTRYRE